jgi:hypothetical protein
MTEQDETIIEMLKSIQVDVSTLKKGNSQIQGQLNRLKSGVDNTNKALGFIGGALVAAPNGGLLGGAKETPKRLTGNKLFCKRVADELGGEIAQVRPGGLQRFLRAYLANNRSCDGLHVLAGPYFEKGKCPVSEAALVAFVTKCEEYKIKDEAVPSFSQTVNVETTSP